MCEINSNEDQPLCRTVHKITEGGHVSFVISYWKPLTVSEICIAFWALSANEDYSKTYHFILFQYLRTVTKRGHETYLYILLQLVYKACWLLYPYLLEQICVMRLYMLLFKSLLNSTA